MPTHEEIKLRSIARKIGAMPFGDNVIFKNAELVEFWRTAYEQGRAAAQTASKPANENPNHGHD